MVIVIIPITLIIVPEISPQKEGEKPRRGSERNVRRIDQEKKGLPHIEDLKELITFPSFRAIPDGRNHRYTFIHLYEAFLSTKFE
jgi:hypothetical protein